MKADLPLRERQRMDAADQREIRAALVRRHAEVLDEQHALEGAQIAMDICGPAFAEMALRLAKPLDRQKQGEGASRVVNEPAGTEQSDLRSQLGLG